MFTFRSTSLLGIGLTALVVAGCDDGPADGPEPISIAATAAATPNLSTLTTALEAAGLVGTLEASGPFTVFAPNNVAFDALDDRVLAGLLEDGNVEILERVLSFHVVAGAAVLSGDLSDGQTIPTVDGGELSIAVSGGGVTVNGANVVSADVPATNGVVHIIDAVLVPTELDIYEKAVLTSGTTTVAAAILAAELDDDLQGSGPFTVFAPIDDAFEALGTDRLEVILDPENQALLQKILTYHVVPGDVRAGDLSDGLTVATLEGTELTFDLSDPSAPKVNGAGILTTDIVTENGVIHLVDGVLLDNLDVVDVATVEGFPTLVSLVEQQGLTATLRDGNGGDGFTVFAPTEAAFAGLDPVPTGQALTDVLTYHVASGTVASSDLSNGQTIPTLLSGADLLVGVDDASGAVTITDEAGNTVSVLVADVPAANGVIHVIEAVLIPSS